MLLGIAAPVLLLLLCPAVLFVLLPVSLLLLLLPCLLVALPLALLLPRLRLPWRTTLLRPRSLGARPLPFATASTTAPAATTTASTTVGLSWRGSLDGLIHAHVVP